MNVYKLFHLYSRNQIKENSILISNDTHLYSNMSERIKEFDFSLRRSVRIESETDLIFDNNFFLYTYSTGGCMWVVLVRVEVVVVDICKSAS